MNILYLNNSVHLGGDTKCILKLCKEFNNEKNKVIIASNGGIMQSEFEKIGIAHFEIGNVKDKSVLNIIKIINQIRNIVKDENIDIIHSHHRMTTLLAKIASKFIKVKVIHTQHLCIEDKFKLTNLSLKNIRVITVSEAAKRILIEKANLNERYITTIYNTIETSCENKMVDSKLVDLKNKGNFIVAQVSRVIEYKGVYDFIEVAKKTGLENKKIKFLLIGDGPELNNIKRLVKEQNLECIVYILGAKDNVIEHLKYIDVLLLCSYIEGLPLAPLEAFSQGIPVIATNIDGTNEEIIDGENGYLVEVKDIDGFKKNIINICNNIALLTKLKEKAQQRYRQMFNEESYIRKHKEIYNEKLL